jgi:hypothetical protein
MPNEIMINKLGNPHGMAWMHHLSKSNVQVGSRKYGKNLKEN